MNPCLFLSLSVESLGLRSKQKVYLGTPSGIVEVGTFGALSLRMVVPNKALVKQRPPRKMALLGHVRVWNCRAACFVQGFWIGVYRVFMVGSCMSF